MLILLVGPKGSGKSHIGRLLERALGVHFFHVEPHWMAYHEDCARSGRERTIAGGIQWVHPAIAEALREHEHVCIETTGASPEILEHLLSFGASTPLWKVRVRAPLEVCTERISARDPTHQIPVDAATIERIYALATSLELPFDLVIENDGLGEQEILEPFARALRGQ